jgi:hypothetical protein
MGITHVCPECGSERIHYEPVVNGKRNPAAGIDWTVCEDCHKVSMFPGTRDDSTPSSSAGRPEPISGGQQTSQQHIRQVERRGCVLNLRGLVAVLLVGFIWVFVTSFGVEFVFSGFDISSDDAWTQVMWGASVFLYLVVLALPVWHWGRGVRDRRRRGCLGRAIVGLLIILGMTILIAVLFG